MDEMIANPTTETPETQLANRPTNELMSFSDVLMADVTERGYWASFPVETMEDKKRLYVARNDNDLLRDYMGDEIEVKDIVIDIQQVNDAQVGAKNVPCVHIVSVDGTVYQSLSSGVVTSACDIMSTFGTPDTWTEPLSVVCKETNTANGYRYKYLAVV